MYGLVNMGLQLLYWLLTFLTVFLYPVCTLQCNCVDNRCLESGTCEDGYNCKAGYYGEVCEKKCSHCGGSGECYMNGTCTSGCRSGYSKHDCSQEGCDPGMYGPDCTKKCPQRCKDSKCTYDGHCLSCNEGLVGESCCKPSCASENDCDEYGMCHKGCKPYKYGWDCSQDCSPYCSKGESCEPKDGLCESGCSHGLVGEGCIFLGLPTRMTGRETRTCHCHNDMCRSLSDNCADHYDCIHGWFGYHCAYKDAYLLSSKINEMLGDNKIETCQPDTDMQARAKWDEPIMFSFAVLTYKEEKQLGTFTLVAKTDGVEHTFTEDQTRSRRINSNVIQIGVPSRIVLTELTISWKEKAALCSLQVSGDRNLALEFATSPEITGNSEWKNLFEALTDGYIVEENCINTEKMRTLSFPLPKPVLITRVTIFPDYNKHAKAKLNLTRRMSAEKYLSQVVTLEGKKFSTVLLNSKEKVDGMELKVIEGNVDICEMEIFGECASPYYGFACKERCPDSCPGEECDYVGRCLEEGDRMAQKSKSSDSVSLHRLTSPYVTILLVVKTALMVYIGN